MPVTLPGTGTDVATSVDPSGDEVQRMVIVRSDALGTPVTADANGMKVQLASSAVTISGTPTVSAVLTTGSAAIGKLAANSGIDIGDVDVTSVIPGTGATALGKAVDSPVGATDTGVAALFVRVDTPATITPAVNDYTRGIADSMGRQWARSALDDGVGGTVPFPAPAILSVTPTLDTAVYASGDSMHTTVLSFANATVSSGGSGTILKMTIIDDADQAVHMKLHLFSATVTPAAANAPHALSDAHAGNYIGTLSTAAGTWEDHANAVTISVVGPMPYKLDSGTTLFGVLVALGAYDAVTTGDIEIKLHVVKDN